MGREMENQESCFVQAKGRENFKKKSVVSHMETREGKEVRTGGVLQCGHGMTR